MKTIAEITKSLREHDPNLKSLTINYDWLDKIDALKQMDEKSFLEFTNALAKCEALNSVLLALPLSLKIGNERFITILQALAKISKRKQTSFTTTLRLGDSPGGFDLADLDFKVFSEIIKLMTYFGRSVDFLWNLNTSLVKLNDERFDMLLVALPYIKRHTAISINAFLNELNDKRISKVFNYILKSNNLDINFNCSELQVINDKYFRLFTGILSKITKPITMHHVAESLSTERFNMLCDSIHCFSYLAIWSDLRCLEAHCFNKIIKLLEENRIYSLYIMIDPDSEKTLANNHYIDIICRELEKNRSLSTLFFSVSENANKGTVAALTNSIAINVSITKLFGPQPLAKDYFLMFCNAVSKSSSITSFQSWKGSFLLHDLDEDCFNCLMNAITKNTNITELPGLLIHEFVKKNELANQRLTLLQSILTPRITHATHTLTRCLSKIVIKNGLPSPELPQAAIEKILTFYNDKKKLHEQVMTKEFPEKTPKVPIKEVSVIGRKFE